MEYRVSNVVRPGTDNRIDKFGLIKAIRNHFGFSLVISKKIVESFDYFSIKFDTLEKADDFSMILQQVGVWVHIEEVGNVKNT